MKKNIIICENIRSILNVGSIFRLGDAVNIKKIYLIGYTPTPIDRFGRNNTKLNKTALGAENFVDWKWFETIDEAIKDIGEDFDIVALEQTDNAINYLDYRPQKEVAVIIGNETEGIAMDTLKKIKIHIEIPMYSNKESLNVTQAISIFVYKLREYLL